MAWRKSSKKKSAVKARPELDKLFAHLRTGDVVVVWKLDRLGKSLRHLIDLVGGFQDAGEDFVSLNDNIDTTTAQGRFLPPLQSLKESLLVRESKPD